MSASGSQFPGNKRQKWRSWGGPPAINTSSEDGTGNGLRFGSRNGSDTNLSDIGRMSDFNNNDSNSFTNNRSKISLDTTNPDYSSYPAPYPSPFPSPSPTPTSLPPSYLPNQFFASSIHAMTVVHMYMGYGMPEGINHLTDTQNKKELRQWKLKDALDKLEAERKVVVEGFSNVFWSLKG